MSGQWGSKGRGSDSMSGRQAERMARDAWATASGGSVNGQHRGERTAGTGRPGKRRGPSGDNQRRIEQATQQVKVTRSGLFGKYTRNESWSPGQPVPPGYRRAGLFGGKIVPKK